MTGLPSTNTPPPTPEPPVERIDDIVKVVRSTKDGRRSQVKLRNGKMTWVASENAIIGRPVVAPMGSPVLSDVVSKIAEALPGIRPDEGETVGESVPRTPSDVTIKTALKVAGGLLTKSEIAALREPYEEALVAIFELVDSTISVTTRGWQQGMPKFVIWSDLDDAQIATVADMFLSMGTRHEGIAIAVRQTVNLYRQGQIIMIGTTRTWKTYQHYLFYGFEMPGGQGWRRKVVRNRPA